MDAHMSYHTCFSAEDVFSADKVWSRREEEEEVNREENVALTLSPPPRENNMTSPGGTANQRADTLSAGGALRVSVQLACIWLCVCVWVCVCACLNANKLILFLIFPNTFWIKLWERAGVTASGGVFQSRPRRKKNTFHNNGDSKWSRK